MKFFLMKINKECAAGEGARTCNDADDDDGDAVTERAKPPERVVPSLWSALHIHIARGVCCGRWEGKESRARGGGGHIPSARRKHLRCTRYTWYNCPALYSYHRYICAQWVIPKVPLDTFSYFPAAAEPLLSWLLLLLYNGIYTYTAAYITSCWTHTHVRGMCVVVYIYIPLRNWPRLSLPLWFSTAVCVYI